MEPAGSLAAWMLACRRGPEQALWVKATWEALAPGCGDHQGSEGSQPDGDSGGSWTRAPESDRGSDLGLVHLVTAAAKQRPGEQVGERQTDLGERFGREPQYWGGSAGGRSRAFGKLKGKGFKTLRGYRKLRNSPRC